MPETPIHLRPQACPKCGEPSMYIVQWPLVDEDRVDLAWFCRVCRHEWAVTRGDAGETAPRREPQVPTDRRPH